MHSGFEPPNGPSVEHPLALAVLRQLPAMVLVVEAPSGRMLLASDAFARWAEERPVISALRLDGSVCAPADLPLARVLCTGEPVRGEVLVFPEASGARRCVEVNAAPVRDPAGIMVAAVAVGIDVTERIEREQGAGLLLSILGHDLRGPLTTLGAGAEILAAQATAGPAAEIADRMMAASARMNRMLDTLADFTRARFASLPMSPERLDFGAALAEWLRDWQLANPGATIRVELGPIGEVTWDRDRMYQALSNLVGNAIQHGAPGQPVDVRAQRRSDEVILEIHNFGEPIPADLLPHIFDRFRGAHRLVQPGTGHLGLGLYITDQIVRGHGGTISVRSAPDEGTTFTLRLPAVAR